MSDLRAIPFLFMRGGTSRGPIFHRGDLPDDLDTLGAVLISALGSGHPLNIDGVGGGNAVTTKVPILSRAAEGEWAEVDYFFAQVQVEDRIVDFKTTCGNMLSAVGPAAIEMGLVKPQGDETQIKIRSVNTGARFESTVPTPGGQLAYTGDARIDGVPGTAAPIWLKFMDVVGSMTGSLLPTGKPIDVIDGLEVTCMDVTMPVVIGRAADFGITGYETREELDANKALFEKMEAVRLQAGTLMGMGDVSQSVAPKFGLFAPPRNGGTISVRYFMPWQTHPTLAVTASQCLAACTLTPGTVAEGLAVRPAEAPPTVVIEHPLGEIHVRVDFARDGDGFTVHSAQLLRTARKLAAGDIYVPATVWPAGAEKAAE